MFYVIRYTEYEISISIEIWEENNRAGKIRIYARWSSNLLVKNCQTVVESKHFKQVDKQRFRGSWPPRSPDLTRCDFFLSGFINSKVYHTQPRDINELKNRISQAFSEVTMEMLHKTKASFQTRLNYVFQNNGR